MLTGLEQSVSIPYQSIQEINTNYLNKKSFTFVTYIYENRHFFELINYEDTIPKLHTHFPQTILKIYQKFEFKTINNLPVNMDYFTRYTAYGFYGLLVSWINRSFQPSQEEFIEEAIQLARTHMAHVRYIGDTR